MTFRLLKQRYSTQGVHRNLRSSVLASLLVAISYGPQSVQGVHASDLSPHRGYLLTHLFIPMREGLSRADFDWPKPVVKFTGPYVRRSGTFLGYETLDHIPDLLGAFRYYNVPSKSCLRVRQSLRAIQRGDHPHCTDQEFLPYRVHLNGNSFTIAWHGMPYSGKRSEALFDGVLIELRPTSPSISQVLVSGTKPLPNARFNDYLLMVDFSRIPVESRGRYTFALSLSEEPNSPCYVWHENRDDIRLKVTGRRHGGHCSTPFTRNYSNRGRKKMQFHVHKYKLCRDFCIHRWSPPVSPPPPKTFRETKGLMPVAISTE